MEPIASRISDLKFGATGGPLEVRILRKWIPHFRQYETWFMAIDKHGDCIQILGQKVNQTYVESKLQVSKCYKIQNYACCAVEEYQKILNRNIYLSVGTASQIEQIDTKNHLPAFHFNFRTREQLQMLADQIEEFLDFIGSRQTSITLWKECIDSIEKFNRTALTTSSSKTVVAVTHLKVSTYAGSLRLSATAATHVYINPPIPETSALMDRSNDMALSIPLTSQLPITIQSLNAKPLTDLTDKTFVCKARIAEYTIKDTWYHSICPNCSETVSIMGEGWFCPTDGLANAPIFFYKLSATIMDDTDSVFISLSDDAVRKLAGVPCTKLVNEYSLIERKTIPPILNERKETTFNFFLQVMRSSKPEKIRFTAQNIAPL
ncbi:hypothetical protein Lser_V15G23393 [Lactuca serriola]